MLPSDVNFASVNFSNRNQALCHMDQLYNSHPPSVKGGENMNFLYGVLAFFLTLNTLNYDLLVILIEYFQISTPSALSHFRPDRFVQLLSFIPILILLLHLLVSIDLVCTGLCELVLGVYLEGEQLYSMFYLNCSGAETTSSFSTYR